MSLYKFLTIPTLSYSMEYSQKHVYSLKKNNWNSPSPATLFYM